MREQSISLETGATHDERRAPLQAARTRSTERAFVIQFDFLSGERARFRGRAEVVASGESIRFRSLKQLNRFMVDTLRRPVVAEPST